MKKKIELKVTEICQISKTFLPAFDGNITTLLLVIGTTPVGDEEHIIIPVMEAKFGMDRIAVDESYSFHCYQHKFTVHKAFNGILFAGYLCLKVKNV